MDNYAIADQLSLLSKLMDIHGENSFKSKSYASAAFAIEKLPMELSTLSAQKIESIRGIGESVGKKILELLQSGEIKALQELIKKTPEGVLEMLNIKGLGPKKINTIWKEMNIDSIHDLLTACKENRLAEKKGFGEKTQEKIIEAIKFQQQNANSYLYAQVESFAESFTQKLKDHFKNEVVEITGAYKRQLEVIDKLEWVTTISQEELETYLVSDDITLLDKNDEAVSFTTNIRIPLLFHKATKENFFATLLRTSSSKEFMEAFTTENNWNEKHPYIDEIDIFKSMNLSFIPSFLREKKEIINRAKNGSLPNVIKTADVKGLIHSHSNWSDGGNTIEQMVQALIDLGFEYLVISDHSKAAFYAGGLSEQKIIEQHQYIDTLNEKYAPFKIFKSIECDILSDGSLDYSNEVLSSFDLVITSIHSNLQMTEEKAMQRLLGAITNPYTAILGHMTGRRLLRRPSYPVDYKKVIDACAENGVAIEINAHPERLDMSWQWIDYALEKNVLLSIDPDAHTVDEFSNIKYGVLVAQKGGLPKEKNLSSYSLTEFEAYLKNRKRAKNS